MKQKKAWLAAITRIFLTLGIFVTLTLNAYSKTKKNVIYPIKLDKQEEQLRKLAYKYRDDIPKNLLKKAKEDNAILHSSWIQGESFASDLTGIPLNIPTIYFPVRSFNDTLFVVLDTSIPTSEPYRFKVFCTRSQYAFGAASTPKEFELFPLYNSISFTQHSPNQPYQNQLHFLGVPDAYANILSYNHPLTAITVMDSCKKDTINTHHMALVKMRDEFWRKSQAKDTNDEELYKNNVWLQKARNFQDCGEYKKALDCYNIFTSFEIDGINNNTGFFAYGIKYNILYCLKQLKRYKEVLNAMELDQNRFAWGMFYSTKTKKLTLTYVRPDVSNAYKDKFLALCKECQQLQEERERNSALILGAIFGAVANTASNIAGGGTSNASSVSSGYTSGSSTSSASASSSSNKTAPKCSACGGTGRCNACRGHIGRATANSKDKTLCKGCGGKGKCSSCGGSGYKK